MSEIEPGKYTFKLDIEIPIELDPPRDWKPGSSKYGKTVMRHYGGEVKLNPPATEEGVRTWLVNHHCADLRGHNVTITHFALTRR